MKRWAPWTLVVVALCFTVFALRSEHPGLLKDRDTEALLIRVREVQDPLAWFKGDWPLQNHFYRPVSTLAFEVDNALYGDSAAGYGRTNALIAVLCIMLLFWAMREITDSPWLSGLTASLFALWHIGTRTGEMLAVLTAWVAPLCLLGVVRGGLRHSWTCAVAALGCLFLSSQVRPVFDFSGHVMHWLPGRTASVMALFALLSVGSYARFARVTARVIVREATAEDVPATKSTGVVGPARFAWVWLVVSALGAALALGSYEQAVMLPALLFGVWAMFLVRGRRSAWWPHVLFWSLLAGYLALRTALIPGDTSSYQDQSLRSGYSGILIVLGDYLLPGAYMAYTTVVGLTPDVFLYVTSLFWNPMLAAVGNVTTYWRAWCDRHWRWYVLGFLLLSFFAFLPMAWVKAFGHYHYLPSAFRAAFVVVLGAVVARLVVSAASLPELQAPARRGPAPGSLLRP